MSNNKPKKVAIVTGSTGYVGRNLVKKLLSNDWSVGVILRPNSVDNLGSHKKLDRYNYDYKYESMFKIIRSHKPDVVFHIASMIVLDHEQNQAEDLVFGNITFGTHLLEAMSANNVKRIVNTSTYWEHYEGARYNPVNLYAATKKAFYSILLFYVQVKNIRAITLELFDVYGPNDTRSKLLNFLMNSKNNTKAIELSPGEQKIDLVHINDVVSAYILAADKLLVDNISDSQIYCVNSKNAITIKELVAQLQRVIGTTLNIKWGGRGYRDREIMEPFQAYGNLPGWKPEITLKTGIKQIIYQHKLIDDKKDIS